MENYIDNLELNKKRNEFRTPEFYLACYLHSKGLKLVEIRRINNSKRCDFVFKDSKEVRKLIKEYWDNEGSVSPRILIASIRDLKNRLYGENY